MNNLAACAALVAFGIVFHFVTKLSELEAQGSIVTPWGYWRQHPYASLTVIMSAYLYFAWRWTQGPMVLGDAILIGIACNSIGDKLRARAQAVK